MLLHEFLSNSAKRTPEKVALVTTNGQWTYRELDRKSDAFAASLVSRGLSKGDRVGIFLGNTCETVIGIFGVLKAGGAFIVINPTTKMEKLLYILNNARCHAFLTNSKILSAELHGLKVQVPSIKQIYDTGAEINQSHVLSFDESLREEEAFIRPRLIDVDLAALIYTSGSTGFPKGVIVTHLNMVAAATSITTYLENVPEDVILNVLPLSFDYGLYQVLMTFLFGGTVILEDSFNYPYQIIKKLRDYGVTGFPGVPTIFAMLSKMGKIKEMDFPSLRYVTNTGAALHIPYINSIREMFPKAKLFSMYGLTECKRVAYLCPEEIDRRPGSVGKAMPNVETYILRDDGSVAGPNEVGELVIRGANVMQGYWEDKEATDRVLKTGKHAWERVLYSGDLFRTDEEGFLYFIGRRDDIIKSRGEKVSPKEVENVLCSMPGIREAAVIGVPDPLLGQAIQAHVVPEKSMVVTEPEIIKFCIKRLESFMIPKSIVFHEALPKTTSGKIDKKLLPAST